MPLKKIKILLIEDDRIEILKLKRAIADEFKENEITIANEGNEAYEILKKNSFDLILLDLNMPDTDGIEFLSILKNDPKLKHIPTIVLTTSDNNSDIKQCYQLGIAGYFLKPLKYEDYELKINYILKYWSLNEFMQL